MMKAIINFALYVCLCRGVSDRTIRAEIARGACTVEEIAACTGAGTGCGRCRPEVAAMILASSPGDGPGAEVGGVRRVALAVVREGAAEAAAAPDETRAA